MPQVYRGTAIKLMSKKCPKTPGKRLAKVKKSLQTGNVPHPGGQSLKTKKSLKNEK